MAMPTDANACTRLVMHMAPQRNAPRPPTRVAGLARLRAGAPPPAPGPGQAGELLPDPLARGIGRLGDPPADPGAAPMTAEATPTDPSTFRDPAMTNDQIDALLRRHEQDDRRLQWALRVMVIAALALVALAWKAPFLG